MCRIASEIGQRDMVYQFMEVHRHLSHYRDVKNAASGLAGVISLDPKLKERLLVIAPKILLLTYDYNQGVRDTMRQLWCQLIDVENEAKVIAEKWPEIQDMALESIQKREFRNRLSGCLVLADLVPNREWNDIKGKFRELFTGALSLWGDDMETIRDASRDLSKAIKSLILRYANLYSNNDIEQLKDVMQTVMPIVQGEVIHSQVTDIKVYGINLLLEIVKSSTQERLYTMDKQERQLAFCYNSE